MIMIKKLLAAMALSMTVLMPAVAADSPRLDRAPDRINDVSALQNGAKLFVNYCLSCHSAVSMRYNKLTEIGLTEEEIKRNLLFTSDKVGDLMEIAMTTRDGANWFGAAPPDLSVIARARSVTMGPSGVDYLYTFLRGFYRDASRTTGWDNIVFPSVGMPHVLWDRQGDRTVSRTTIAQEAQADGTQAWVQTTQVFDAQGFSTSKTEVLNNYRGSATEQFKVEPVDAARAAAFDSEAADLANFLGWMAEPVQQKRKQMGIWVLFFLVIFLGVAWRLNAAYWKDVR